MEPTELIVPRENADAAAKLMGWDKYEIVHSSELPGFVLVKRLKNEWREM